MRFLKIITIILFKVFFTASVHAADVSEPLGRLFVSQSDYMHAPSDDLRAQAKVHNDSAIADLKSSASGAEIEALLALNNKFFSSGGMEVEKMAFAFAAIKEKYGLSVDIDAALDAVDELEDVVSSHIVSPDDEAMRVAEASIRDAKGVLFVNLLGTDAFASLDNYVALSWDILIMSMDNNDIKASEVNENEGNELLKALRSAIDSI